MQSVVGADAGIVAVVQRLQKRRRLMRKSLVPCYASVDTYTGKVHPDLEDRQAKGQRLKY